MPRLWNDTIETHRSEVREAILDTVSRLVTHEGLRAANMRRLAEETGIGRATLYKYFPDIESTLRAWHERQVDNHLIELAAIRDRTLDVVERLGAVLEAFAHIAQQSGRHDAVLAALLHRDVAVVRAQDRLRAIVRDLIAQGVKAKRFRSDVVPDELARYCLNAVATASELPTKTALQRLVDVTMTALRTSA